MLLQALLVVFLDRLGQVLFVCASVSGPWGSRLAQRKGPKDLDVKVQLSRPMLGRLRVLPAERARSSRHDTIQRDGGIQAAVSCSRQP